MSTPKVKNLGQRIQAIMKDMPVIPKNSYNKHGGYKFASRDDIVATVQPLLVKHGVLFLLSRTDGNAFEAIYASTDNGEEQISFIVHAVGSKEGTKAHGTPQSYGGAISYAEKFAHRTLFSIPTGDQDDPDNGHGSEPDPKAKAAEDKATQDDLGGLSSNEMKDLIDMVKTLGLGRSDKDTLMNACDGDKRVYFDAINMIVDENLERQEGLDLPPCTLDEMLESVEIIKGRKAGA